MPTQTPGVESTTRSVLGTSSAPAQWPDCCRLVETIFVRLCTVHPSPKRKGKGTLSRWSLILQDYRRIRQLVLGNSLVMGGTSMQLVEVNQNTLIQWYKHRQKKQELSVLLQGIQLLPNAHGLSQNNQRSSTSTSYQRAQQVRQSKGRLLLDDPLSDPRHQHRVISWLRHQHLEHQCRWYPTYLCQQHQVSRVCRCFRVCQGSGNPDGSGDVNDAATVVYSYLSNFCC